MKITHNQRQIFKGQNILWISTLQIFVEINFIEHRIRLAMPICGGQVTKADGCLFPTSTFARANFVQGKLMEIMVEIGNNIWKVLWEYLMLHHIQNGRGIRVIVLSQQGTSVWLLEWVWATLPSKLSR